MLGVALLRTWGFYVLAILFVLGAIVGLLTGLWTSFVVNHGYAGGLKDAALGGLAVVGVLLMFARWSALEDSRAPFYVAFAAAAIIPALRQFLRRTITESEPS